MILVIPSPPRATLFPYTTLFRSEGTWTVGRHGDIGGAASQVVELVNDLHRDRRADGSACSRRGRLLQEEQVVRSARADGEDRKSTRLNSSHLGISYAVFCLKKKT